MKKKKITLNLKNLIIAVLLLVLFQNCNPDVKSKDDSSNYHKVKHPEWSKNVSIYEVNIRQYTPEGTINAFAEHLPRLKELGTDILWLMPIHPIGEKNRKGTLGSYYAVQDYYAINPEFGTEDDFRNLVTKIHEMGMYVIIDWVANHSAWDNPLINTHPDWYTQNEKGEIISPVDDWSDVADFNYDVPEMQTYMVNALKYWVNEFNIDGYRCDVASMVPTEFWNKARFELDKIKPVFMLAEANDAELHEYAFDMTYSWDMHFLWNDIAQRKRTVNDLVNQFEVEKTKYQPSDYRMTFTSNHDENSWKGTVFERLGDAAETFIVLSATMPGMPLVYSGQEACMDKHLRFFDKDTIDWTEDCQFTKLYNKLFELKKNNPALWNGEFGGTMVRLNTTADNQVFAFLREKDDNQVVTILNLSNEPAEFEFSNAIDNTQLTEIFTGENIASNYSLAPWAYKVYKLE